MPDFFWRRRIRTAVKDFRRSQPEIPQELQENIFLIESAQAAVADRASNAYDEFMFSEDGYEKMPYEDAIDELIDLHKSHVPQRLSVAVLAKELELGYRQSRLADAQKKAADAQLELDQVEALLAEENQILAGEKAGESGSKWHGQAPDITSRSRHLSRRALEWLTFLLVAAVDAVVVFFSLKALVGVREAIWFAIPVIGVQILFPHLAGSSIRNFLKQKPAEGWAKFSDALKSFELYTAILVFLAWVAYVWAMMILRFNVMKGLIEKTDTTLTDQLTLAIQILSLFLLIGYGLWIMLRAIKVNPHEIKSSRLQFTRKSKVNKLNRKLRNVAKAQTKIDEVSKQLERLLKDNWEIEIQKYENLRETAKSVYRRALVNAHGDPEFTTKFLPKSKFTFKGNRGNN